MSKKVILLLIVSIFLISFVNAQSTQYSKIFLSPFYRLSMSQNINYSYTLNIEKPANTLVNVQSAIISFDVYISPTVTFNLWVNNLPCNNPTYTISTTYASAGQSRITFDCSNVITKEGNYNVVIKPTQQNTGAITGWADISYSLSPSGSMTMHGTEYQAGQSAKLWLQLLDANTTEVTSGVCYIDIYTPYNTEFVERAPMTNLLHDGIYYYDITEVPIVSGVYPAISTCYYVSTQTNNNFTSVTMLNGTLDSGDITRTTVLDTSYLGMTESAVGSGNPRRISVEFNSSYKLCNISESLLTGVSLYWTGRWNSNIGNDDMTFNIYNYTSGSWVALSNKVSGTGTGVKSVSNSLSLNNLTEAGLVNSSGSNLRLRINDTFLADATSSSFDTDYLSVTCDQLASPGWQQVKGSSEMHVTSTEDYLVTVTDYDVALGNLNTTLYNGTVINEIYYTGIFTNKFTVEPTGSTTQTYNIEYQGLHSLPANSYISFYKINATGYYPYNFTTQAQTTEGHNSLNFQVTLAPLENAQFEVHARNTWESEFRSINTGILAVYPLLSAGCDLWAIANNETPYPYIVTKNQTTEVHTPFYRACNNWYDDYYWFNQTYTKGVDDKNLLVNYIDDVAEIERGYFLQIESDYFSNNFAGSKLKDVTYLLLQDFATTGIYSNLVMADPLNRSDMFGNRFFANVSDGRINTQYLYLLNQTVNNMSINYTQIADFVWSSPNRSITNQVTINETSLISSIASAIWGWTGSISSTVTNTFSSVFWSNANYTEISRYVWEYGNRSLTFYQVNNISVSDIFNYLNGSLTIVDTYNYSKSAEYTWMYVDRNLTSTLINNLTVDQIWSFYNRSLSDNGNLQIWNYPSRNLTDNLTSDLPLQIWSYQNRTLTYYTINLTEFLGMIANYTYSDVGIPFLPSQQQYQVVNYNLNVILVSPQYAGNY